MSSWGIRGKASILFGGQFGSEGKGLAAAWLAEQCTVDIATTNAGAQAGHTTVWGGTPSKFICFHLPTTGVIQHLKGNDSCINYINGGSIIDIDVLRQELMDCGVSSWPYIHPRAAVISDDDRTAEKTGSTLALGSTQKGIGAAISGKIMRRTKLMRDFHTECIKLDLNEKLYNGASVVVEVPQGFDLSLNHGFAYPHCTSRDCWVGSGLSDAGIHPKFVGDICMVVRTFPIRVGHIHDQEGNKVGDSGPFFADSNELSWENDFPDVEPERTTVTKRVRRIASWSKEQYRNALSANRPTIVFMNFANYFKDEVQFITRIKLMKAVEQSLGLGIDHVYGFGPSTADVTTDIETAYGWFKNRSF